jgi:hypothetical protein
MKTIQLSLLGFLLLGPAQAFPATTTQWEEIPVDRVFIPATGFDDNDNVELVTDGLLPNGCYTIGPAQWDMSSDGRTIHVHQFAHHDLTGYCADEILMPTGVKRAMPFTVEVPVGQLATGDYHIKYNQRKGATGDRAFNVTAALTRTVDSLPYALVTGIELPDYLRSGTEVTPVLTGILTSTCARLNPGVSILNEGDVFVALPTQTDIPSKSEKVCNDVITPFRLPISLGQPGEGRYLLQARSMNGKAVNKTFSVFTDDLRSRP